MKNAGVTLLPLLPLACASAPSSPVETPTTTESAPPAAESPSPPPGPCSARNEAFAGITTTTFTYENGKRTRAVESGPAGERQTLWTYDPQGRRSKQVEIDGASIRTHTFHYENNLLVREDVFDAAAKRVVEQRARVYDDGKLRERTTSAWVDEGWVVVDHHALHYDDTGRFVYELRTRTPVGEPKQVHSITVDVDTKGRVVARRVDEGMDGSFDRVSLFDFDERGRLATATQMRGEAIDSVARHTYDEQGRMIRTDLEDGAGKPLGHTTYDFSCWD